MEKVFFILVFLIFFCIFALFYLVYVQKSPARGWLFYPIVLALLPLYFRLIGSDTGSGQKHNYLIAFAPIVLLTIVNFLVWCGKKIVKNNMKFQKGPLFYPLLGYLAAITLSLFNAKDVPAGLVMVASWGFIIFLYIVIYNNIDNKKVVNQFVYLFIGATVILAIIGMANFGSDVRGLKANAFAGENENFLEKNHMAFILEEALFFALLIAISKSFPRKMRAFCFLAFLLLTGGIIFSLSRGAWVATMGAFAVLVFFLKTKGSVKAKIFLILALLAGMAIITFSMVDPLQTRLMSLGDEDNYPRRIPMLMAGINAFLDYPIIGVGIRNFVQHHFFAYVSWTDLAYFNRAMGINNLYIRMLAEAGLLGFLALMWIFWTIFREVSLRVRALPKDSPEQILLAGFLAGFVANLIHFNFLDLIYPLPWVFFFFGLAMTRFHPIMVKAPPKVIRKVAYARP